MGCKMWRPICGSNSVMNNVRLCLTESPSPHVPPISMVSGTLCKETNGLLLRSFMLRAATHGGRGPPLLIHRSTQYMSIGLSLSLLSYREVASHVTFMGGRANYYIQLFSP